MCVSLIDWFQYDYSIWLYSSNVLNYPNDINHPILKSIQMICVCVSFARIKIHNQVVNKGRMRGKDEILIFKGTKLSYFWFKNKTNYILLQQISFAEWSIICDLQFNLACRLIGVNEENFNFLMNQKLIILREI